MQLTLRELLDLQDRELKKDFVGKIFGFTLNGTYSEKDYSLSSVYKFQNPNKVKIEIRMPDGKKYTEGYDGSKSWELTEYVNERASAALKQGAEWPNYIKSIKDFLENGHMAEYVEIVTIKEQDYHKVALIQQDGFQRNYFIHSISFQIHYGQDVRPLHPKDEIKSIQTEFTEYKNFGGVKIPVKVFNRDLATGEQLSVLETDTVEINPDFAENEFEKLG